MQLVELAQAQLGKEERLAEIARLKAALQEAVEQNLKLRSDLDDRMVRFIVVLNGTHLVLLVVRRRILVLATSTHACSWLGSTRRRRTCTG